MEASWSLKRSAATNQSPAAAESVKKSVQLLSVEKDKPMTGNARQAVKTALR
jgi:hypothetical protein